MPFDPALPGDSAEIESAELRSQFQSLRDLIAEVPTVTAAQVDAVTPLPPGSLPAASVALNGNTLHFTFDLPAGADSAVIDSVSSVGPADPASASVTQTGTVLHFSFSIPRGFDGAAGAPGEVSNAALSSAIGGTSSNSNGVGTLDTPFADPDDEALRGKLNELLVALRR